MTRKDYILLAESIRTMTFPLLNNDSENYHKTLREEVADKIAGALKVDNYRFDYDKWDDYIFPEGRLTDS